jgi:ABC-type multidrug transport system fused ATPase/permease subunit
LFSTLGDSTSGVTTIRAFGRQEHFARRYKEQTDTYNQVRHRSFTLLFSCSSSRWQVQLYAEGLDRWLEERSDMVGATVSFIVGLLCLSSGLSSGVTGFLISTGKSAPLNPRSLL